MPNKLSCQWSFNKAFLVSDKYPTRKTENKRIGIHKIDVDFCKPGYFKNFPPCPFILVKIKGHGGKFF